MPGAYPRVEHQKDASPGKAPALIINIDWKGLIVTSTLANYEHLYIAAVKRLIILGPVI
jgi:hypothetical protein